MGKQQISSQTVLGSQLNLVSSLLILYIKTNPRKVKECCVKYEHIKYTEGNTGDYSSYPIQAAITKML